MEDKIKFKISKELQSIMKDAFTFAVNAGDRELSVELVIYKILHHYLTGAGKESPCLLQLINDMDSDTRLDLERCCLDEYNLASRRLKTLPKATKTESICLSEDLEEAFRKAHVFLSMKNIMIRDKKKIEISTQSFFIYGLLGSSCPVIDMLKDNFNISSEQLFAEELSGTIEKLMDSELEKPREGDMKEKRIMSKEEIEDEDNKFECAGKDRDIKVKKVDPNSKTPTLDQFGTCMTEQAKDGKYDVLVGRDKEISQVIEIICCRKKNNAALLGDPGCGKTAIVEGLAQRIVEGKVPVEIKNKRIFSVSTTDLQAGTIYRGQLEQRIQDLCEEVKNNPDVIVYIDEFHQAVSEGSSSIAQMLKPALGRGEMQMIVSTTVDEYRKFIEKDGALKRRFEKVLVEEPTVEETKLILTGLAETYEKFHHVRYTPEIIEKCVEWAGKYINDRFFPDKAIGILDMASSLTKLHTEKSTHIDELEAKIEKLLEDMEKALDEDRLDDAENIRLERINTENEISKEKIDMDTDTSKWPEVTIQSVLEVISKASGVPVDKIKSSDMTKIKAMKTSLANKVIGQNEAIEELTIALQRNILGLRDPRKPIASFLLVGSTGVGKSLVAKTLAEEFFGSEKNLVSIACSEYMQDWAESKLLGSAPGYVGFSDSEPRLYILKRKPYTVILIDEVEKSSSNLYNIWLNMLEEGEVTLSSGEKVSCRNAIIIFTGNVGTKSLELKGNGFGFSKPTGEEKKKLDESIVMKEVKKEFRPEFLNRLSKVIVFNSLGKDELKSIFNLELGKLQKRLKENNGYDLTVSDAIKDLVVSECEPEYGARSLQRLIVKYVEQEICKAMLDKDITGKTKISVDYKKSKVAVSFK